MDDVKTLLAGFRQETTGPDPAVLAAARRRLVARTLAPEPRRRERPALRIGLATGAVGAVAAGLLLVPQLLPDPPSAAAVELLDRAADAAGRSAPAALPGPGEFLYTRTVTARLNAMHGDVPVVRDHPGHLCHDLVEEWVPGDGRGRTQGRAAEGVTWAAARDPGGPWTADPRCLFDDSPFWRELDAPTAPWPGPPSLSHWVSPRSDFLAALPADARGLHDRARQEAVDLVYDDTDDGTLTLLSTLALSRSPEVTPALRATLFRAIALVPGVDTIGDATTLLGDTGAVVARTDAHGRRQEIVIDPDTGTFLGGRRIVVDSPEPGVPDGAVYEEWATRAEVVAAAGERPPT